MASHIVNVRRLTVICAVTLLHSISLCSSSESWFSFLFQSQLDVAEVSSRVRRAVNTLTVDRTVPENSVNVIFSIGNEFPDTNRTYTTNSKIFVVDNNGDARLKSGQSLDYDTMTSKIISVSITATNTANTTDITTVTVNLRVTDLNDENPRFTTQPHPFLATVTTTTPSGTSVFRLEAQDPDTAANLQFSLISGAQGRFTLTPTSTGNPGVWFTEVRTQGSGSFQDGQQYNLLVAVRDIAATSPQEVRDTVFVLVGTRQPQFYSASFLGLVKEETEESQTLKNTDGSDLRIQAKSFQGHQISLSLASAANAEALSWFCLQNDGTVTTKHRFDYEAVPPADRPIKIPLTVTATEAVTNLQSTTNLVVQVDDVNDHAPVFSLPSYSGRVSEGAPVGTFVANVTATDEDTGVNAELEYMVAGSNLFTMSTVNTSGVYVGQLLVNGRLDYDRTPDHRYRIMVIAKDKGSPSLSGTSEVMVYLDNISDEPPEFLLTDKTFNLAETSVPNTVVTIIQAVDWDGDTLEYFFTPNLIQNGFFTITSATGFIRLNANIPNDYNDTYPLDITVRDKGDCCNGAGSPSSTSDTINIKITVVNDHKPVFPDCASYSSASVPENSNTGTFVITVKATDEDRGDNERLTYTIFGATIGQNNFNVGINSGDVTTARSFDRETEGDLQITVRVSDNGLPSLVNYCTFRVKVTDVNDNAPVFDQPIYNPTISNNAGTGQSVFRVRAFDKDEGENARVTYAMTSDVSGRFTINVNTGDITLLQSMAGQTGPFTLQVLAQDNGSPSLNSSITVTVNLDRTGNQAPDWNRNDYTDTIYSVNESISGGHDIARFEVVNTQDSVNFFFVLRNGLASQVWEQFTISTCANNTSAACLTLSRDGSLDYNRRNVYYPRIRVSSDKQMSSEIYPVIQVIDTNNMIPVFGGQDPQNGFLPGDALENTTKVQMVAEIKAYDADVTYPYNALTFSLLDQTDKFTIQNIDNNTARVTTQYEFDFETTRQYVIQVKVEDGAPSSLTGVTGPNTAVARLLVRITDQNDNPPAFDPKNYTAKVKENAVVKAQVVTVTATDIDTIADPLVYSITAGNLDNTFRVQSDTGNIFMGRPLDYETLNLPGNSTLGEKYFNLTLTVQDGNPLHSDTATVVIAVEDVNDHAPVFVNQAQQADVPENFALSTHLPGVQFSATDADDGINKLFDFHIDRATDRDWLFDINSSGNVVLRRHLDREKQDVYYVGILAIDRGKPALTGTASLTVRVSDINDNPPIITPPLTTPQVMENTNANNKEVVELFATDKDTPQYGPPFVFSFPTCADGSSRCPCNERPFCDLFSVTTRSAGNGSGIVRVITANPFDREQRKSYMLPVVVKDTSGTTNSLSSTYTLQVIIGDENDNKHSPGHENIFVYNYKGEAGPLEIGSVYAEDLDDWDVVDKSYIFTGAAYVKSYFSVNEASGKITMFKRVPTLTDHNFTATVKDAKWNLDVESSVTVRIQELPEDAVALSGSMRLSGITAEEFVKRPKTGTDPTAYGESIYSRFHNLLASKLNLPLENVMIVSVKDHNGQTDVRYAAQRQDGVWLPGSETESVVARNKGEFERVVGVKIAMVPIDGCNKEEFEGGCYNLFTYTGRSHVVDTNGTVHVGVETSTMTRAGCRANSFPDPVECSASYCYNGGTCTKNDWGMLSCSCLGGFDGPRCQSTHHSFDGQSFALYPPLEQCENGRTSIEVVTRQSSSLILYNGPVSTLAADDPRDFISLEMENGYPKLRINHGGQELQLQIDGRDAGGTIQLQPINDGRWHRIDIIRRGQYVELLVDLCRNVQVQNGVLDDAPCRKTGSTPDKYRFLNVNTLLQLGGRYIPVPVYPDRIQNTKLSGCVRNLIHNGMMYNLQIAGNLGYSSGQNGCVSSLCSGQCQTNTNCPPGMQGSSCNINTMIREFRTDSYLKWRLNTVKESHFTRLQIMFRTRDLDGILLTLRASNNNTITLLLKNGYVGVEYNLGGLTRNLMLNQVLASNGQWHAVDVQRYGHQFILKMDGGEGRNQVYTLGRADDGQLMTLDQATVIVGGASEAQSDGGAPDMWDLTETTIQDIRLNGDLFPLTSPSTTAATVIGSKNVVPASSRSDCQASTCNSNAEVCYPNCQCVSLWGSHKCRCPPGKTEAGCGRSSGCADINLCANNPCGGHATCQNVRDDPNNLNFTCVCPPNWSGRYCMIYGEEPTNGPLTGGLTTGGVIAIVVSLIVLLLLLLLVILFLRCYTGAGSEKHILEVYPDDDIRENIISYDEEGAGEEDNAAFDLSRLQKQEGDPALASHRPLDRPPAYENQLGTGNPNRSYPDIPDMPPKFVDRIDDADNDADAPPHDRPLTFAFEGNGSDAGTLSSLNTSTSSGSQDYDYLNDWGPKFAKLADMYGVGPDSKPSDEEAQDISGV